jgi:hypothetical protein
MHPQPDPQPARQCPTDFPAPQGVTILDEFIRRHGVDESYAGFARLVQQVGNRWRQAAEAATSRFEVELRRAMQHRAAMIAAGWRITGAIAISEIPTPARTLVMTDGGQTTGMFLAVKVDALPDGLPLKATLRAIGTVQMGNGLLDGSAGSEVVVLGPLVGGQPRPTYALTEAAKWTAQFANERNLTVGG